MAVSPVRRPESERASAVADFAMVAGLVSLLFLAVFQVGMALHIRNTLIACASEGARYGARADSQPADGVSRASQLIRSSLSGRYAERVTAARQVVGGIAVVRVQVEAPLPLVGTFGPAGALRLSASAFAEDQ